MLNSFFISIACSTFRVYGYILAPNKCDKYIKTLCEFGLVRRKPEKNGHTKYYPANSYIALWYKTLLTAVPNSDGSFGEDVYEHFMRYFNDEILSAFYKEMCAYWLDKNVNSISTDYIDTKDLNYRNVKVGEVTFDFVCEKKRAVVLVYNHRHEKLNKLYL